MGPLRPLSSQTHSPKTPPGFPLANRQSRIHSHAGGKKSTTRCWTATGWGVFEGPDPFPLPPPPNNKKRKAPQVVGDPPHRGGRDTRKKGWRTMLSNPIRCSASQRSLRHMRKADAKGGCWGLVVPCKPVKKSAAARGKGEKNGPRGGQTPPPLLSLGSLACGHSPPPGAQKRSSHQASGANPPGGKRSRCVPHVWAGVVIKISAVVSKGGL